MVWVWCAFLVGGLLLLKWLPAYTLGGYQLKPVNIISDIEKKDAGPEEKLYASLTDSDRTENAGQAAGAEPVRVTDDGLALPIDPVPVEDYSEDQTAMQDFHEAVDRLPESGRSVHIAFMGDSFVEGDILTAELRDTLQEVFGGGGVGFLPLASGSTDLRPTILQKHAGIHDLSVVDTVKRGRIYGISGHVAVPDSAATNTFYAVKNSRRLHWFKKIQLFHARGRGRTLRYKPGNGSPGSGVLEAGRGLHVFEIEADSARSIRFSFPRDSLLRLYGVNFEQETGVYLDNFALRGNAGYGLYGTSRDMYRAFDSLLNYKLIVLQYGLNALSPEVDNYDYYRRTLVKVIRYLQAGFPRSSILVIGIGDRSERRNGEYVTMSTLPALLEAQRAAARETGVAFWDMHKAMGGVNSIVRFVNHEPALANKDYTHINRKGGAVIARQLAKALLAQH